MQGAIQEREGRNQTKRECGDPSGNFGRDRDRTASPRDRQRAAGQGDTGKSDEREDRAPCEIENAKEISVTFQRQLTATRTSTRVRRPRGGDTLNVKRVPCVTPAGTDTVSV